MTLSSLTALPSAGPPPPKRPVFCLNPCVRFLYESYKKKKRPVSCFVGICFCLCFRLSLFSPLPQGRPLFHAACPPWPVWMEVSADLAFLLVSLFHAAFLQRNPFSCLSQRFSLVFLFCSALFLFICHYSILLHFVLSSFIDFSTCPLIPETLKEKK